MTSAYRRSGHRRPRQPTSSRPSRAGDRLLEDFDQVQPLVNAENTGTGILVHASTTFGVMAPVPLPDLGCVEAIRNLDSPGDGVRAPSTRYATVGNAEVAYQVIGDGPVDLVYHHGLCHVDLQWDIRAEAAFNEHLASFARVVLFDRRGTGASERGTPGEVPTWEDWSEDLRGVLDAVGIESAAIFAEAEAGATAILFAATYPGRVRALVLANTAARYAESPDYPVGLSQPEIELLVSSTTDGWGSTDAWMDSVRSAFRALRLDESELRAIARLCRAAATPRLARTMFRYVYERLDVREALPLVQAPTLVIHDQAGHREAFARYLVEHITDAQIVGVPGENFLFFAGDYEPVINEVAAFLTGEPPQVEIDRILTTVMFTDIVDSTRVAAEMGDQRWRAILDSHDRLVRGQLRRFRGEEVNTTGDGFVARFDGPARAVRCALAITHEARDLGIEIRSGLHTGECELRNGDIAGLAVHVAARISSRAEPSDVLVSRTVADLVAGAGLAFADRGDHVLKGVPGEWRILAATKS
jgi:class 3 adenylate cyclase